MAIDLLLRSEAGAPLTAVQHDSNLTLIQNAVNATDAALGVALNPDGTLKDGAVTSAAKIANAIITIAKLAAPGAPEAGKVLRVNAAGTLELIGNDAFSVCKTTSDQAIIGNAGSVKVTFNSETYDKSAAIAASTFTAPRDGEYIFHASLQFAVTSGSPTAVVYVIDFRKNGAGSAFHNPNPVAFDNRAIPLSAQIQLLAGDTVEVWATVEDDVAATYAIVANNSGTLFSGVRIG